QASDRLVGTAGASTGRRPIGQRFEEFAGFAFESLGAIVAACCQARLNQSWRAAAFPRTLGGSVANPVIGRPGTGSNGLAPPIRNSSSRAGSGSRTTQFVVCRPVHMFPFTNAAG